MLIVNKFKIRQLKKLFPKIYATKRLVFESDSFLHKTGWIQSLKNGYPCGKNGRELPWMNYAVISFLENRLKKSMSLFEFGSGYSSIFFSRLVNDVTAVEHNPEWIENIQDKLPANVELIYCSLNINSEYCQIINKQNKKFDVIVVDGYDRINCIYHGLNSIKDDGVLILDDSNRTSYRDGIRILKERGYKSLQFVGLKPTGIDLEETTVFYKENNCLKV